MDVYARDLEKHPAEAAVGNVSHEKRPSYVEVDTGAVPDDAFDYGTGVIAKTQRFAGKFKIEQRGIERVPENERTDDKHPYLNVGTMVCRLVSSLRQGSCFTDPAVVAVRQHGCLIVRDWRLR